MTGASYNKGRSKQDYATPVEFIGAFARRFGPIGFDLAANLRNTVARGFFSEEDDALSQNWHGLRTRPSEWLWLNPPFSNIAPWVRKCSETRDAHPSVKIALLATASVGSHWWLDYVHNRSRVHLLRGRISFDGKNPFPKDCALCLYGLDADYREWDWRKDVTK